MAQCSQETLLYETGLFFTNASNSSHLFMSELTFPLQTDRNKDLYSYHLPLAQLQFDSLGIASTVQQVKVDL